MVLPPGPAGLKFWRPNVGPSPAATTGALYIVEANDALSAAGGPIIPDGWDRTYNAAAIYSDNDRTAALDNADHLLSTTAHLSGATGRFYVEITVNSLGSASDLDLYIGTVDQFYYVVLYTDGNLYDSHDFNSTYTHLAITDGDVVGIAYNAADNLVWIRVNNGYWNTGSGDNPTTDVGGVPGLGYQVEPNTPIHLGVHSYEDGNGVTINTGTVAWANALPSGYSAWWASEVTGALGATEIDDTLSAAGTVASPGIDGALAVTQTNQTLAATGGPIATGTLTANQAAHTLAADGTVVVGGTLTATQTAHGLGAIGKVTVGGTLAVTEADDALAATATIDATATLNLTQAAQTLIAAATADALGVTADSTEWTADTLCVTADGHIVCIPAIVAEPASALDDFDAVVIAGGAVIDADLAEAADAADIADAVSSVSADVLEVATAVDELDAAIGAQVLFGTVAEAAGALDALDASVDAVAGGIVGGGHYYPQQRPSPVYGVGYGLLPQLWGEAHGVVGVAGKSAAQLLVRATAIGACGHAGDAAVVLKGLVVAGKGAVGTRGAGQGLIVKFSGSATGQHDDDEAAVLAFLLAA